MLIPLLALAFLSLLTWRSFSKTEERERRRRVLSRVRWWMFPAGVLTLTIVLGASLLLFLYMPYGKVSWLNLFGSSGGNILVSSPSTDEVHSSSGLMRSIVYGVTICLLLTLIPLLAHNEEEAYRWRWHKRSALGKVANCLYFGLSHLVVGVPLAVALALSIGGFYFGLVYSHFARRGEQKLLKEDVDSGGVEVGDSTASPERVAWLEAAYFSAAAHTVYNYLAIGVGLFFLLWSL